MLGFLSSEREQTAHVTKDNISFVSVPNDTKKKDIKMLIAQKAKLFADTLNLDVVYLHIGKDIIKYDYKV